jgi:hypothetical protein
MAEFVQVVTATALQNNRPMLPLFESMGFVVEKRLDSGVYELKMSFVDEGKPASRA